MKSVSAAASVALAFLLAGCTGDPGEDDDATPDDDAAHDDDSAPDDDAAADDDSAPDDDVTVDDDTVPDDDAKPDDDVTADDDTASDDDSTPPDALAEARATWDAAGLAGYTFVLAWSCFGCPPAMTGPAEITVVAGTVAESTYVDGGAPTTGAFDARTVDGLFDFLVEAIDGGADQVTASYDPSLGYPVNAYVDYDIGSDDEELGFAVTDFTPG